MAAPLLTVVALVFAWPMTLVIGAPVAALLTCSARLAHRPLLLGILTAWAVVLVVFGHPMLIGKANLLSPGLWVLVLALAALGGTVGGITYARLMRT